MTDIYKTSEGRDEVRAWCQSRIAGFGPQHETRVLSTGLGETHVLHAGASDAQPVVLLPGTNFNTATWLGLVDALARELSVVSLDMPGQPGLSSSTRHRHINDLYGGWLFEVLDVLELDDVVVVGHSLGARIALRGAAKSERVRGAVLLDPAGLIRLRVGAKTLMATMRWLRGPDAHSSQRLVAEMLAPGSSVPPELAEWMTLVGRHVRTSLAPSPLDPRSLRAVKVPVVVASGVHDTFVPARRLARAVRKLPNARLELIGGAGHLMPFEKPNAVVAAIRSL